MGYTIKAGGVTLPAPTKVTSSDELIWSSNTGRTSSGKLDGTLIANKLTVDVEWGILTETELKTIANATSGAFFSLEVRDNNAAKTLQVYRGTLKKEQLGYIGDGIFYYRNATVSFIEV